LITARPLSNTATDVASATMTAICHGPVPIADQQSADADFDAGPDDELDRSTQPLAGCHVDAGDGRNRREQGGGCPKRCTPTYQERPAAKAAWTSGTATLRQQRSRPIRCSRRRELVAEVIGMPLGRVGHRLGSDRVRRIFLWPVATAIGHAASQQR
jgi:hypothetical protein